MSLQIVPLQAVANQSVTCPINGITHTIEIDSRRGALYLTLWRGGEYVVYNRALRSYAPIEYGLQLVDLEGTDDPQHEGLGVRWLLMALQAQNS